MENLSITVAFLLIGVILKRMPDFPENASKVLNLFAIYLSMPALILLRIPRLTFSSDILTPLVMPWMALFFSAGLIWLLSKALKWSRPTTGCLLLLVPLGNTSFFGIPVIQAFFGDQAISYALLYDQFGSFLALASYGSVILMIYSAHRTDLRLATIVKKILFFPPFVALVVALLSRWLPTHPPLLTHFLEILASTLIPLVMIAVGLQLRLRLDKNSALQLAIGLTAKLALVPITALLVCRILGLEGEAVQVSIFEAGMPPMVTAGALAAAADLSPALAAAMVGIGLVVSFVTLSLLFQLL